VQAAEDNTIRLALIGSGSRGSGAVINAFESPNGPCKLVAMADIFADRLEGSYKALSGQYPHMVDVPPERRFVGFDAYKKAIDCLRPGVDIAMLTTYPAFRPVHLDYAVSKGVNVFMVRYIPNCYTEFATFVHGTKRAAQFSGTVHSGTCHIYRDQRCAPVRVSARYNPASGQYVYTEEAHTKRDDIVWRAPKENYTCWQAEWNVLLNSIRHDLPQNEAQRAAYSNLTGLMGRAAMHMGRVITWEEMLKSNFQLCPNIDAMTEDSPPPVLPDANGRYPVPVPGQWLEV
jgi:hypothetical protein